MKKPELIAKMKKPRTMKTSELIAEMTTIDLRPELGVELSYKENRTRRDALAAEIDRRMPNRGK